MTLEKELAEHLKTVPSISALVGSDVYWRMSPDLINKDHIRIENIDTPRIHNLRVALPLSQVSAFSKDFTRVRAIADAVIAYMRDGRLVVDGTFVVSVLQDDRLIQEKTWWHAPMTFAFKYQEA